MELSDKQKDMVKTGIERFGGMQLVVAIEELSELQKEICKHIRGKTNKSNIVEEVADVLIMVETLVQFFNLSADEMNCVIDEKLERVAKTEVEKPMECVWHFYWDCGKLGSLEGIFKATEEELEDAFGEFIYFGDALGDKHSGMYGPLDRRDIRLVTNKPLEVLGYVESGYNPLEYIEYTEWHT